MLRLVISNDTPRNTAKPSSRLPTPPPKPLTVSMEDVMFDLNELLFLKPTYVGAIAGLVHDQLERQRREHPDAAADYQRSLERNSG